MFIVLCTRVCVCMWILQFFRINLLSEFLKGIITIVVHGGCKINCSNFYWMCNHVAGRYFKAESFILAVQI